MSKFLHVGMSLSDVVRASTVTPAKVIGWDDRIGSLATGRTADIALFKLDAPEGGVLLEDCQSQVGFCFAACLFLLLTIDCCLLFTYEMRVLLLTIM
jgi:hypothetical protein